MKNYFTLTTLLLFFFLNSCCSWNDSSKKSYLTECESKLSKEFCECSLNKLMEKFACYDEAVQHEEDFADIMIQCHETSN
jgi:predicted house-cleaning noncanonical NTP pyrophosphatase (MazG superfamily)